MSPREALDTLRERDDKSRLLKSLLEFLNTEGDCREFESAGLRTGVFFCVSLPREVWEPQLSGYISKIMAEIDDLDKKIVAHLAETKP